MDTKLFEIKTNFLNENVEKAINELKNVVENSRIVEGEFIGQYMTEWGKKIREIFKKYGLDADLLYDFKNDGYHIAIMVDIDYIGKVKVSWVENNKVFCLLP